MIHASALAAGAGSEAVEALVKTLPYEAGLFGPFGNDAMLPVYLRGQAYLLSKQRPQAAAEFQKVIDHPQLITKLSYQCWKTSATVGFNQQ